MKTYFIGIYKKNKNTLVLQAVTNKDCLNCETWLYYGERLNTKANISKTKNILLAEINKQYNKSYKYLIIE